MANAVVDLQFAVLDVVGDPLRPRIGQDTSGLFLNRVLPPRGDGDGQAPACAVAMACQMRSGVAGMSI